jgi:hypothetical protein
MEGVSIFWDKNHVFMFIHSGLIFKVLLEKGSKDEGEISYQERKKKKEGNHMRA